MDTTNKYVPPQSRMREILKKYKKVAMVGISADQERNSFKVGRFLVKKGYKVIPVNPNYDSVLGEKSYASLLDIPFEIDIVDIFRRPEAAEPIVEEAIKKGAKVVWMQEGVINEEAARKAKEAGLEVVMDRCIYKEYKKHFM